MGAGTGYFLQLATGSPHGLDTTRGVPGDRLMSSWTPAAPNETVSLRWERYVPRSHLVISPLLAHLRGGVLTTSPSAVGQPCEKVHPCSGPVFLAFSPRSHPWGLRKCAWNNPSGQAWSWSPASQLQPPPVSLPQGSLCWPRSQDRLFMGWEGDSPWVHLCPLQLCAVPVRALKWSASCGKEPPPGNSWSDSLNLRRGSLAARVGSHPPAFPLCNPLLSVLSPPPAPMGPRNHPYPLQPLGLAQAPQWSPGG